MNDSRSRDLKGDSEAQWLLEAPVPIRPLWQLLTLHPSPPTATPSPPPTANLYVDTNTEMHSQDSWLHRCTLRETPAGARVGFHMCLSGYTHSDARSPPGSSYTHAPAHGGCSRSPRAKPTGGEDLNGEQLRSCSMLQAPEAQASAADRNPISDP